MLDLKSIVCAGFGCSEAADRHGPPGGHVVVESVCSVPIAVVMC